MFLFCMLLQRLITIYYEISYKYFFHLNLDHDFFSKANYD